MDLVFQMAFVMLLKFFKRCVRKILIPYRTVGARIDTDARTVIVKGLQLRDIESAAGSWTNYHGIIANRAHT
jgi:hypothetical protein